MDGFMDMLGRGFILGAVGLGMMWRFLNKKNPELANAAKKAAARKAITFIASRFK